jgi:multiple sugar transport system substrate-binding protein
MKEINVLAVADPAVYVYVDKKNNFLNKFEEETGIHVNFDIVAWTDYYTTLLDSFDSYKYDIVMVAGHLWLKEFVEKGYLRKIESDFTKEYDYEDFVSSVREEIEINNSRYLFPSFCDGHILLYRKSQVNNNFSDTVSIDEVINYLKHNGDNNSFVLKAHPSEIFLDFLPYLRSEGIDAFDKQGNPLFNTEAGTKALNKYIGMKKYCVENVNEFGNEEVLKTIQKNKCKLGVSWGGQLGQIMNENCKDKDDICFASLETSWNVTWSFGINKQCIDQSSAEQFLMYITSKEVDKEVGAYCGNPTRISSFKAGEESYKWYPVLLNMLKTVKPLPHLSNMGQLIGLVTEEIVKAFNEDISSKEALENAYNNIMQVREGV